MFMLHPHCIIQTSLSPLFQSLSFQPPDQMARSLTTASKSVHALTSGYFSLQSKWNTRCIAHRSMHWEDYPLFTIFQVELPSLLACTHVPSWPFHKLSLWFPLPSPRLPSSDYMGHGCKLLRLRWVKWESELPTNAATHVYWSCSGSVLNAPLPSFNGLLLSLSYFMIWWIQQNSTHSEEFQWHGYLELRG